jgi:ABC-2 type transport system permease protein
MTRLVAAEFRKLLTTQVWFWMLVGTVVVAALLAVAQVAPSDGIRSEQDFPDLFAAFASTPAYVLLFVLGVLGVTTEFRYQTITPTLLQTPSRWAVVTSKMITYAIVGVLYALVALVVEAVVGLPWLSAKNVDVHLHNGQVWHAIWGTFVVITLFGIIGLGIGALLKNQVVAVVVGILFLVVLENVLLAIPVVKHAWPYMPNGGVQAILRTSGDSDTANGVHLLSAGGGVIVLLLWAFVPAIIGASVTMNRDIT